MTHYVQRVFNNSAVLAARGDGTTVVLFGRGLGFGVRRGDRVDATLIERTFVPTESASPERIATLVQEIPREHLDVSEEILHDVRALLGEGITDHLLIPLADHLSFALRRAVAGAPPIEYPLRWEVESLYPREVEAGRVALDVVARRTGIVLPPQERVALALHFVTTQLGTSADMTVTMRITEVLRETLRIVSDSFGVRIDESSAGVARFMNHLRHLFQRQQRAGTTETADGVPREVVDAIRGTQQREYRTAQRIAELLTDRFGWPVDDAEVAYLTLHVARLSHAAAPPRG